MSNFVFYNQMKLELEKSLEAIRNGKTVLYPTDTVWGIGCDATDFKAVEKIYKIKERSECKSLIVLVDSLEMLKSYVNNIPSAIFTILDECKRPTTIIYNEPIGLAKNIVAKDNTMAIRVVQNEFCKELIKKFGKPIISTSANISGRPTPKSFDEIGPAILDNVDYSVNLHRSKISNVPSRILKVDLDGKIIIIRD
jgi:L-threonylcarbamoyladenylate synthase